MGKEIIARGQAVVVCQKDGYTINQSVGEYIFHALNNGTIGLTATFVSTIKVTSGDNIVTNFTIGTINKPAGFSIISVNNNNKTITYVVDKNTTTLADNGTIPIPIIIEGNTYTISFKWAKSKDGQNGSDGKPGTDGYTVSASRNSYIVSTDKDGRIHTAVTTNTTISILKGSTPVTPTIGALPTVAGCTLSKSGATVTIVFNVGTSLAENGTISIPVVADGKSFAVSFSYAKARAGAAGADSNMLDWVKDWNNNKTQINENSVITPKIFAGTKNSNGTLTGVAMGKFSLSVLNSSGVVTTETINGIYGFKDGYKTFYVNNTGDAGLGRGNQFIRYNATTGKIEFGSDVSLNWTQPIETINTALGGKGFPKLTYIDGKGIYTGTLTAEQVNAVNINASSIKTGILSADRIAAGSIRSDKLDANSIQTNIINTSYIQGLSLNFTKGKIGGWNISESAITKNSVSLGSDGSITNGTKWKLNNDGSGQLANGNIKWNAAGTLTFSSNALPTMKDYEEYTIDATGLNENTYYPVCITISQFMATEISVHWTLNSGVKPSWATHSSGSYSVRVRWTANGSGWGTIPVTREILEASQSWNNGNIVGDIGQLTNASVEYIYVRGGGKYIFRVKNASGVPVLRSTGYTTDGQTVSPKTSVTFPVARLTKIDANGIYTGTLTASQINAANCNFTQGKIGGFTIYGHKISTYDNPTDGHIIEIHKTGYICNSRKSDSKDYWALNADGSASFGMGSTTFHASGGFVMTGNSSSKFNIDISGTNFFRVNDGSMVSVRGDGRTALSVSTYGSNNSTKGISVLCNASGYGYAIESYGNVLLNARSGERIRINGLHVSVRNIYSTASLYSNDDLVIIQQTSTDVTITLPNCQDGKIIYVKSLSSRWYNIKGTIIDAPLRNSVSSFQIKDNCARIFIKCSSGWLMFYCG